MLPVRLRGRRSRVLVAVTVAVATGSACTAGPAFEAGDLDPGPCRDAAPELRRVDTTLSEVADGELQPAEAGARYQAVQERLQAVREAAEPEVADALQGLVSALGFYRIGVDAGTLGDAQPQQVRTELDGVLGSCGFQAGS